MPGLPVLTSQQLISVLNKLGFKKTRQKGSHIRFVHPDGRRTTVPFHSSSVIGRGLLNKIMKQDLKITREEFMKYL